MGSFCRLLSETFNHWLENKAQRLGAALAYYAAFSFAPLLVLLVTVANFIYKEDTLTRVQSQIALMAGNKAAETIVATICGVPKTGGGGGAAVFGLSTPLLWGTGMLWPPSKPVDY